MKKIICYTSGGSHGNPGPAGIGIYITDETKTVLQEVGQGIGNATDVYAAYYAVMVGLETVKELLGESSKTTVIEMRLENEVVKKQLNAEYQIEEPGLVPLFIAIHNLRVANFANLSFTQMAPKYNQDAQRLLNEVLDGKR